MMKLLLVYILVLSTGVQVARADCGSEMGPCHDAFLATGMSRSTFCPALDVYKACLKKACDELPSSAVDKIVEDEFADLRRQYCGSAVLGVSVVNVVLVVMTSLFFNTA